MTLTSSLLPELSCIPIGGGRRAGGAAGSPGPRSQPPFSSFPAHPRPSHPSCLLGLPEAHPRQQPMGKLWNRSVKSAVACLHWSLCRRLPRLPPTPHPTEDESCRPGHRGHRAPWAPGIAGTVLRAAAQLRGRRPLPWTGPQSHQGSRSFGFGQVTSPRSQHPQGLGHHGGPPVTQSPERGTPGGPPLLGSVGSPWPAGKAGLPVVSPGPPGLGGLSVWPEGTVT